nr:hypothetical protein [Tanacetum cinerariifolium]
MEYYYADYMNTILGVYTKLDEVTNLQCDYLELLEKCEGLETELSKSKMMSKSFESVQKHAINLELELQQCKEKIKNDMLFKVNKSKYFCKEREQYFEIQDLKAQLQDKGIVIRVIPTTSVSRPQLKSNPQGDRVMHNNSQGKKQEVEDHHRSVKLPKNKKYVTTCNDNLNAKILNVKSVSTMCDKYVLIDKRAICVLKSVTKPLKETVASESNKKPRNFTRKLYERVSKTCSWWYPKFTPSGKTSLVKMGVIMELHEGECCWWATRGVVKESEVDHEEGNREGGNEGVGVSAYVYWNMSVGEWQVYQAQWMGQKDERWGRLDT